MNSQQGRETLIQLAKVQTQLLIYHVLRPVESVENFDLMALDRILSYRQTVISLTVACKTSDCLEM